MTSTITTLTPRARLHHVWHALMYVIGHTHRDLWSRNRSIQQDITNLMKGK